MTAPSSTAWLELDAGARTPILGNCSLGRSPKNTLVLTAENVSRRHALIHLQGEAEFWLVDLGSGNGTRLNDRRVFHPVRLRDGDRIEIGEQNITFRTTEESAFGADGCESFVGTTVRQVHLVPCWLLVADIENFTPLSQTLSGEQLARTVGGWLSESKRIIETHHGAINKYLGDGFFAYWEDQPGSVDRVGPALDELRQAQVRQQPAFRLAVHHGNVTIGGSPTTGEVSMLGPEVNFLFRMEKVAATLGISCLLSQAANALLAPSRPTQPAGEHTLKGFPGGHLFYSM